MKKINIKLCAVLLGIIVCQTGCGEAGNETSKQAEGRAGTSFSAEDKTRSESVMGSDQENATKPTVEEEKGKLIIRRTERAYSTNEVLKIYEYEHNSDGCITEKECSPDGTVLSSKKYDENKNVIEYIEYGNNEIILIWEEYDANGNEIKDYGVRKGDEPSSWEEYFYDKYGNKVKSILYREDGSVWTQTDYSKYLEYIDGVDEKGNKITTVKRYNDLTKRLQLTCVYDSNNNLVNRITNNGETKYEYDSMGRLTDEFEIQNDGNLSCHIIYTYDILGNKKAMRYSGSGVLYKQEEYDKSGNLLHRCWYNKDGELEDEEIYEYDLFGYMTKSLWTNSGIDVWYGSIYENEYIDVP